MRARALGLSMLLVTGSAIGEDSPPLIDLERFFDDPRYMAARLSPDGERVTFQAPYQGAMNIWVKDIDESLEDARPITAYDRSVSGFFWSRDSRHVLFAQDDDGDENYQVLAVDPAAEPDGDNDVPPARDLTDADGARAIIYHVPRETPEEILVGLNERDPAYHDVYRISLDSGERERVVKNEEEIQSWYFHEGELRKASRQTSDGGTQILSVSEEKDAFEPVYACDFGESCGIERFHADGERVYLRTNAGEDRDLTELVLLEPDTGEQSHAHRDPEGDVDLGGTVFADEDDRLLATVYEGERQRIYPQNDDFAEALDDLQEQLPEGNIDVTSTTADDSVWTVSLSKDTNPGAAYIFDVASGDLEKIYETRPDLPTEHLASMEPITYEARDGTEIPGYLTLPPGSDGEDLPLVVHPHGGPWIRDTWGFNGSVQFLANRGYAVLQPNFRGSTGYGKEFLNAGNRGWGTGVMQHDVTDGVKHLIDEGIADPDRIAIYGASYGGYATLAGLAFTPDLYAAGVSVVGPSNIITMVDSFPPYWESGLVQWHRRVGDPDDPDDRERLKEQSPVYSADEMNAPLMVVHGANDPRVVQAESDQIVSALRDSGHDVEYLVADDEGHGFVDETNRLAFTVGMERFLAEHIGGRKQDHHRDAVADRLTALQVDVQDVEDPSERSWERDALATASLPPAGGDRLKEAELTYSRTITRDDEEMNAELTRTWSRVDDPDALDQSAGSFWRVEDASEIAGGEGRQVSYLRHADLLPAARVIEVPGMDLELAYDDDAITGRIEAEGQEHELDESLEAPVFGDAGGLDTALAGMELEADMSDPLRYFDPQLGTVRQYQMTVTEYDDLEVEAGEFPTYRIEAEPLDDEGGERTWYVRRDAPHIVVKSHLEMANALGGGDVYTELSGLEGGDSEQE